MLRVGKGRPAGEVLGSGQEQGDFRGDRREWGPDGRRGVSHKTFQARHTLEAQAWLVLGAARKAVGREGREGRIQGNKIL